MRRFERLGGPTASRNHDVVALSIDGLTPKGVSAGDGASTFRRRDWAAKPLTAEQLGSGCTRLVESIADLQLDYPRAPELLAQYLERCCTLQLLPQHERAEWQATAARLRAGGGGPTGQ